MIERKGRFEPRLGKARGAAPQRPASFIKQILRAANRSGRSVRRSGLGRQGSSSFGRGSAAALAMRNTAFARRVVIKPQIVRHNSASGNSLGRHGGDAIALQTAMQGRARQMRDYIVHGDVDVIERLSCLNPQRHDRGFLD